MDILLSILALLLSLLGIIGAIFPLPGILFSYAGLLCVYFCSYSNITPTTLYVWAAVSIIISIIDFLLPPYFTKKFGGSKAGVIGSTIGMFAGFMVFPPLGIIICPLFGAVLGELYHDREDVEKAFKIGLASFISFIFGTGLKLIATIWMLGIFLQSLVSFIRG